MYAVRVGVELGDRLDAEFYNPIALGTVAQIESHGSTSSLGRLISEGYRVVYHGTDSINGIAEDKLLPFLSPSQIDDQGSIDFDSTDKLPLYYKTDYPKGVAKPGELLIEVKGNVSKVGVVPDVHPANLMISGSLYKASFRSGTDSRYVLAFLKSRHGQILKNRLTSNTIINYIAKDDLYSIPVLLPGAGVQKYIGDKVRQAERLRAWAKSVELSVKQFHADLIPSQSALDFSRRVRRVSQDRMTERLDAHFYPAVVDEYLREHPGRFRSVREVCSDVFNGQTQPEAQGDVLCKQVTVTNLSATFLVGSAREVEPPGTTEKFLRQHDILMCNAAHNKAYIGRELTYVHSDFAVLPSTEVMTVRVDRSQLPASYVRAYFLSKLGFVQIQSTIRGITAHSYPGDVALLDIFIPDVSESKREDWFACDEKLAQAGVACELATALNTAAKYLVEALIDRRIDEATMIAASEELAMDERFGDRAIMARLKVDGFDAAGQPLIADLEDLYRLASHADQT